MSDHLQGASSPDRSQSAEDYLDSARPRWSSGRPPLLGRTVSGTFRPRLAAIQSSSNGDGTTSPGSPRTPLGLGRSYSSAYNSPSQTFRTDDEVFVFEFGARHLSVGLGGEEAPRCTLKFSPDTQKRTGDYSQWLPDQPLDAPQITEDYKDWAFGHELWRLDVRQIDIGLVADKIERAVRTALSEHVLVQDDSKKRQYVVVIPPALPHPLISTILNVFFETSLPPQTINLLTSPLSSTISAGLRSSLIVDIGWAETVITPVYEYRELFQRRSVRSMKKLSWETAQLLSSRVVGGESEASTPVNLTLFEAEDTVHKLCHLSSSTSDASQSMAIPVPSHNTTLTIPFDQFSIPPTTTFLSADLDSEDDPLPELIYDILVHLPIDIRSALLARIVFVGGGATLPGLRTRILKEVRAIISRRGWDPTANYGSASSKLGSSNVRANPARHVLLNTTPSDMFQKETDQEFSNKDMNPLSNTAAHMQPQLPDPVLSSLEARRVSGLPKSTQESSEDRLMDLKAVRSLGPWAGGSLLSGLRVPAAVEIDRERFREHGLAAYTSPVDENNGQQATSDGRRKSAAPGRPLSGGRPSMPGIPTETKSGLGVFA